MFGTISCTLLGYSVLHGLLHASPVLKVRHRGNGMSVDVQTVSKLAPIGKATRNKRSTRPTYVASIATVKMSPNPIFPANREELKAFASVSSCEGVTVVGRKCQKLTAFLFLLCLFSTEGLGHFLR